MSEMPNSDGDNSFSKNNFESIPDLYSIDLPCYFHKLSTSIDMLGGSEEIRNALLNKSSLIHMKTSQSASSANGFIGERKESFGMLVKLIRKRKGLESEVKMEIIGKTSHTYAFDETSDYVFLPSSTRLPCEASSSVVETFPRPFKLTHKRGKVENFFKDQTKPDHYRLRNKVKRTLQMTKFGENIPPFEIERFHEKIAELRGQTKAAFSEIIDLTKRLFDRIPVLSRRHCEENMKIAAKNNLFLDNLHRVAFCYSNGPFKSLLVRLGYDVKNDPKTRYFQTVTMKFSSRLLNAVYRRIWRKLGSVSSYKVLDLDSMRVIDVERSGSAFVMKGKLLSQSYINLHHDIDINHPALVNAVRRVPMNEGNKYIGVYIFGHLVKCYCVIQLCNVMDESFYHFLTSLKRLPAIDSNTGWFSAMSIRRIRLHLQRTIVSRLQKFLSCTDFQIDSNADVSATTASVDDCDILASHLWTDRYVNCTVDNIANKVDLERETEEFHALTQPKKRKRMPANKLVMANVKANSTDKFRRTANIQPANVGMNDGDGDARANEIKFNDVDAFSVFGDDDDDDDDDIDTILADEDFESDYDSSNDGEIE